MNRAIFITESIGSSNNGGGSLSAVDFTNLLNERFDDLTIYTFRPHLLNNINNTSQVVYIKRELPKVKNLRDFLKYCYYLILNINTLKEITTDRETSIFVNSWPLFYNTIELSGPYSRKILIVRGSVNFLDFIEDGLGKLERSKLYADSFNLFDSIIFVSKNIIPKWIEYTGYNKKIFVLRNAIRSGIKTQNSIISRQYANNFNIVLVGSIQSRKNQGIIELAAKQSFSLFPHVRFHLIGGVSKTHGGEEIYRNLASYKNIIFHGHRQDVSNYIYDASLCLFTSKAEALPRTLIEYISFGKITISSDIDGNSEMIIDNETGFLFNPDDQVELWSKIKFVIENHQNLQYVSKNAKDRYSRLFTLEAQSVSFDKIMDKL